MPTVARPPAWAELAGIADESNGKVYGAAAFTAGADNNVYFPGAISGTLYACIQGSRAHLVAFDAASDIIAKSSSFNYPSCL